MVYILTNPATLRVLWLIKANVNEYACVCVQTAYIHPHYSGSGPDLWLI